MNVGLAVALHAATGQATPARHEVSVSVEGILWFGSAYTDALRAFDRSPLPVGGALALRYTRPLGRGVSLGVRGGWAYRHASVDLGEAGSRNPVGPVAIHLGDVGAVLRLVTMQAPSGQARLRVQFDLEAGVVGGAVTTVGVSQGLLRPRFAGSVLLGFPLQSDVGFLGVRLGVQYVPWDGAGGSGADPAFGGLLLGVEGGLSP